VIGWGLGAAPRFDLFEDSVVLVHLSEVGRRRTTRANEG
jgi:hypothetical protein